MPWFPGLHAYAWLLSLAVGERSGGQILATRAGSQLPRLSSHIVG